MKTIDILKVDDKLTVWDKKAFGTHKAHFAGYASDGSILCYRDGKSSWTGKSTKQWENYEKC